MSPRRDRQSREQAARAAAIWDAARHDRLKLTVDEHGHLEPKLDVEAPEPSDEPADAPEHAGDDDKPARMSTRRGDPFAGPDGARLAGIAVMVALAFVVVWLRDASILPSALVLPVGAVGVLAWGLTESYAGHRRRRRDRTR